MKVILLACLAIFSFADQLTTAERLYDKFTERKAADEELHPKLGSTLTSGWNTSRVTSSGNWGYETVLYADLGATYSFPLYDEDPYMF